MENCKVIAIYIICIILSACGNGNNVSGTGGPTPPPTPVVTGAKINIGNVSTIPLGLGSGNTTAIVTNNISNQVVLTSATYTLYGDTGTGTPQDATAANSPVNTSLCTSIQARSTCSLGLSVPIGVTHGGQYSVTMNYINPTNGKTITAYGLISYSFDVAVNTNGIQVSTINNTIYNVPGSATTYAVPFVTTGILSDLLAVSEHNNPVFAPTISCPGVAPYPAGTTCTLFVKISGTGDAPNFSGNIIVTGNVAANAQNKRGKAGTSGMNGTLFNVPIFVVQTNTGNLITSAINVTVNPADGTSPRSITLLNNGNGLISNIHVIANAPTVIGNNYCTGTLAVGAACSFSVNATLTMNAQDIVVVNYDEGSTSNSVPFNITYLVVESSPGLSMTPNGTLNNTVINTSNSVSIDVKNTGTAELRNITFTPATLPAGMAYDSSSTCAINGTQSLIAGASCILVIKYAPTVISSGPFVVIGETAEYTAPGGGTAQYTGASAAISYSAVIGQAFVYITPNYVAYGISADNIDKATQTFVLINAGPVATQIISENLANPAVTAYTTVGGTCVFPQTLGAAGSGTESCTVVAQFGPTSSTINTASLMMASYTTSGSTTATAFSTLSFTSSPAALVRIESVAVSNTSGGAGLSGNPYTFVNSPAMPQIEFTITYQNTGTQDATSFNVGLSILPVGYYSVGGTCGTGATTSILAASGGTCTAIFRALDSALYNSYSLNSPINFQLPGFSYVDASTGMNSNTAPTFSAYPGSTVYVTPTVFATVTESAAVWNTAESGGVNTLKFLGNAGTPAGTQVTILNQASFLPSIIFGTGSSGTGAGNCVITGTPPNGSCTIPVTNLSGLPPTTAYFLYMVSPAGSPLAGIIQSGSFTYTH